MREFAKQFYRSTEWAKVRSYVLKRDLYLCTCCGQPADVVHHKIHLTPQNIYDVNISLNPENLVSLCADCHYQAHRGEHGRGRQSQEENTQAFDENGYLIAR